MTIGIANAHLSHMPRISTMSILTIFKLAVKFVKDNSVINQLNFVELESLM